MLLKARAARHKTLLIAVLPLHPEHPFGYAPPRRAGDQAQFTQDAARRQPHYRREGRVSELDVRELFHGHPGPHRRRRDLDYLHGLLSHDVRAQDAPRRAVPWRATPIFLSHLSRTDHTCSIFYGRRNDAIRAAPYQKNVSRSLRSTRRLKKVNRSGPEGYARCYPYSKTKPEAG